MITDIEAIAQKVADQTLTQIYTRAKEILEARLASMGTTSTAVTPQHATAPVAKRRGRPAKSTTNENVADRNWRRVSPGDALEAKRAAAREAQQRYRAKKAAQKAEAAGASVETSPRRGRPPTVKPVAAPTPKAAPKAPVTLDIESEVDRDIEALA